MYMHVRVCMVCMNLYVYTLRGVLAHESVLHKNKSIAKTHLSLSLSLSHTHTSTATPSSTEIRLWARRRFASARTVRVTEMHVCAVTGCTGWHRVSSAPWLAISAPYFHFSPSSSPPLFRAYSPSRSNTHTLHFSFFLSLSPSLALSFSLSPSCTCEHNSVHVRVYFVCDMCAGCDSVCVRALRGAS